MATPSLTKSPRSSAGSKSYSLSPNSRDGPSRQSRAPQITVTKSRDSNDNLNKTHPQKGDLGNKYSNLRSSKTDLLDTSENRGRERPSPRRSKTPTPSTLKSSSAPSISKQLEHRRSITPTPTVTSQRRAALSKSPGTTQNRASGGKSPGRAPPSAYRNSETLPRNYRSSVEISPRKSTGTPTKSKGSVAMETRSATLPRPSSARPRGSMETDTDSVKRSTTDTLSATKSHHRSMQDIRKVSEQARPKSALGNFSSALSTVPTSKKSPGRSTIASPPGGSMQRLGL